MNVTIPEAGNDGLAGAINDARIFRDLDFAAAADCGDDAVGGDNDGVQQRRGIGRGIHRAAQQNQCLRVGCDTGASRRSEEQKEKRAAAQMPDHVPDLLQFA